MQSWKYARYLSSTVLILLVSAASLEAQAGILSVRVSDGQQPITSGVVDLYRQGDRLRRAELGDRGIALFTALPAGSYDVRVEALGHRTRLVEDVVIAAGQARVLDVTLEVVPVELESITASAARVQIQRQNTEFSTTVDEVAIKMLPVAHDAKQLVALTPGARAGHVWGGANFQANNYMIDGLSANHPGMGGDLIQPSITWIERVEVRGLGSGAEYGGFQGGLVDVITKTGSNDFTGMVRTSVENEALNASNLVGSEIGTEVASRFDVEGEVSGALVADRLFYYLSGQHIQQDNQALNHLLAVEGRFSPFLEQRSEDKLFGKLTWAPRPADQLEVSAGYLGVSADNYDITGYEAEGAALRYSSPTWFGNLAWRRVLGTWGHIDARVNHFARDERSTPYAGPDQPGIRFFSLTPPYTSFGNAPFAYRSAPASTSGTLQTTIRFGSRGVDQLLKVGAEYTRGSFLDRRTRSGGMTWLPVRSTRFDPDQPDTWSHLNQSFVPTAWGGEVNLDADVANGALYAQGAFSLGSRVVLSPGVRWGWWEGYLTPRSGERFRAVRDAGLDPRLGVMVELTESGSLVAKGHWGRYHQNMIAQMFDRALGADVFTNEEFWYYSGPPITDPTTRFTEAERDALAAAGQFTRQGTIILNETGPVEDYRQPYIDQWLVGIEKQFGTSVKLEALYTRRTNHDMIALVDHNRATNYVRYDNVRVYDASLMPLPFSGGTVVLDELYLPTYVLIEQIKYCTANPDVCSIPPLLAAADTLFLTWDPDYALTTAPDARREFGQFQFTADVSRPTWGGSFSVVVTDLEGNLDNVSGYADPTRYGAGPYVHPNEHVNSFGLLPNFAEREAKVSVWGMLPWELRGGLFYTYASGDHYSPRFRLSSLGLYRFKYDTGASVGRGTARAGAELFHGLLAPLEGQYVFIGPRGVPQHQRRANFDIRLERIFEMARFDLAVSADLFNVFNQNAITELNTMVNNGPNYYWFLGGGGGETPYFRIPTNEYYLAPLERVSPRTLRLGMEVRF